MTADMLHDVAMSAAACAEFPNDNPALHRGAIWWCPEPCSDATPELQGEGDDGVIEIVDEIAFDGVVVEDVRTEPQSDEIATQERAPGTGADLTLDDPFATLVHRIAEVARASGGSDDAVRGLRWLLERSEQEVGSLAPTALEALRAAQQVEGAPEGVRCSGAFTETVRAWRGILRGESDDFSACGAAPLDEWAADLVARVLGNPMRAAGLRRDLRRRGVAAFGLIAQET